MTEHLKTPVPEATLLNLSPCQNNEQAFGVCSPQMRHCRNNCATLLQWDQSHQSMANLDNIPPFNQPDLTTWYNVLTILSHWPPGYGSPMRHQCAVRDSPALMNLAKAKASCAKCKVCMSRIFSTACFAAASNHREQRKPTMAVAQDLTKSAGIMSVTLTKMVHVLCFIGCFVGVKPIGSNWALWCEDFMPWASMWPLFWCFTRVLHQMSSTPNASKCHISNHYGNLTTKKTCVQSFHITIIQILIYTISMCQMAKKMISFLIHLIWSSATSFIQGTCWPSFACHDPRSARWRHPAAGETKGRPWAPGWRRPTSLGNATVASFDRDKKTSRIQGWFKAKL